MALLTGGLQDPVEDEVVAVIVFIFFNQLLKFIAKALLTLESRQGRPSDIVPFLLLFRAEQQFGHFSQILLFLSPFHFVSNELELSLKLFQQSCDGGSPLLYHQLELTFLLAHSDVFLHILQLYLVGTDAAHLQRLIHLSHLLPALIIKYLVKDYNNSATGLSDSASSTSLINFSSKSTGVTLWELLGLLLRFLSERMFFFLSKEGVFLQR